MWIGTPAPASQHRARPSLFGANDSSCIPEYRLIRIPGPQSTDSRAWTLNHRKTACPTRSGRIRNRKNTVYQKQVQIYLPLLDIEHMSIMNPFSKYIQARAFRLRPTLTTFFLTGVGTAAPQPRSQQERISPFGYSPLILGSGTFESNPDSIRSQRTAKHEVETLPFEPYLEYQAESTSL